LLITASDHYAKLLQEFQPLLSNKDTGNSGKVAL
jgi:hypothetical protein